MAPLQLNVEPVTPKGGPASDFVPGPAVAKRYGVTPMTFYRWLDNPDLAFPRPLYIGRFRYWRQSELIEWERSRPRSALSKRPA